MEGSDIPAPCTTFEEMRLPGSVVKALEAKGIKRPTPIQMQGIPVALCGRDMIGVAFTGSGKTLVFSLPMVMAALQVCVALGGGVFWGGVHTCFGCLCMCAQRGMSTHAGPTSTMSNTEMLPSTCVHAPLCNAYRVHAPWSTPWSIPFTKRHTPLANQCFYLCRRKFACP